MPPTVDSGYVSASPVDPPKKPRRDVHELARAFAQLLSDERLNQGFPQFMSTIFNMIKAIRKDLFVPQIDIEKMRAEVQEMAYEISTKLEFNKNQATAEILKVQEKMQLLPTLTRVVAEVGKTLDEYDLIMAIQRWSHVLKDIAPPRHLEKDIYDTLADLYDECVFRPFVAGQVIGTAIHLSVFRRDLTTIRTAINQVCSAFGNLNQLTSGLHEEFAAAIPYLDNVSLETKIKCYEFNKVLNRIDRKYNITPGEMEVLVENLKETALAQKEEDVKDEHETPDSRERQQRHAQSTPTPPPKMLHPQAVTPLQRSQQGISRSKFWSGNRRGGNPARKNTA